MTTLMLALVLGQCTPHGCAVTVRLHVEPPDAEVWAWNDKLPGPGPLRTLISPILQHGFRYQYRFKARWGSVERTWDLVVEPGQTYDLTLKRDADTTAESSKQAATDQANVPNFGIDLGQMGKTVERFTLNDRAVTRAEAVQMLEAGALPDDSGKPRLTIIGPEADRQRVLDDLRGPLADLAHDLVIQAYAPDHWAVARAGFFRDGKPTIYLQEPTGKVLHRQDDYADGPDGLRVALEAIRKPKPDYDRTRDLDLRTPTPSRRWVLIGGAAVLAFLLLRRRS